VSVTETTVRGAATLLDRVDHAEARVGIDPSGINIEEQVDLVPVDANGEPVEGRLELSPATATVEIVVEQVETRKTVPVTPQVSGTPAGGYTLTSITVEPPVVTLVGLPGVLSDVTSVGTEPVFVDGVTEGVTADVALILPDDAQLADGVGDGVTVTIDVQPTDVTRTFAVGVGCVGAAGGVSCLPAQEQVAVTLSGPVATISALTAGDLIVTVDVTGLDPGQHALVPALTLPAGTGLVGISPGTVTATLVAPQTPSPTPTPVPADG
jgi:YbbR domain-containing protein